MTKDKPASRGNSEFVFIEDCAFYRTDRTPIRWCIAQYDDGKPTSAGIWPDLDTEPPLER
ncbi:hypothetical protein [Roseinatronobacter sp. S2]|uniref:hypothetical protein n=1 Tax=Roseinatronobacter sp. S2 TaxID=3035471 RepID=UPI002410786C|nr:hypothetical protein [Roseinatronobacter sp. S2]WFE76131.1 hypothetical protein P8S53_06945 [Roseinatronobacter sp. S2]